MNKRTKYLQFSKRTKELIIDRDGGLCIICGRIAVDIMHYIPKSQGGLGIEQNGVCGCRTCHHDYDNGSKRIEYGKKIKEYLESIYGEISREDITYKKGM